MKVIPWVLSILVLVMILSNTVVKARESGQPSLLTEQSNQQSVIAFTEKNDIYVMDMKTGEQERLTKGYYPRWSPNGKKIVFVSAKDGNEEIYVMDSDGKNRTRLTESSAFNSYPEWSPDGKKIVFVSSKKGSGEIYIMDSDGKNQTRLTENGAFNSSPEWSPDGKKIAFVSVKEFIGQTWINQIYIMDSDGKNQTRLTWSRASSNIFIEWSPDGKKILFISDLCISVIDSDGKNQANLTENNVVSAYPKWSPDGKRIAFVSGALKGGDDEIYIMNSDGTKQTKLTTKCRVRQLCSFGSNKILFVSGTGHGRDYEHAIYELNIDSKEIEKLTDGSEPQWQPKIVQWSGPNSQVTQKEYHLVKTKEDWEKLWNRHTSDKPIPEIDFTKEMCIGIFQGKRFNSDGVTATISEEKDRILVRFDDISFQTVSIGSGGGGVRVTAFGIFVLPHSTKQVVLEENTQRLIGEPPIWTERKIWEAEK
jgi:Tol biopolymer transport system component